MAPFGTMCTIDYWHGNFKHYRAYMTFLMINGFFTPFMVMSGIYFKGLQNLVKHERGRSPLSKFEHKHIVGMAKLCAIGFINVIFAWSPFFLLCLCKFQVSQQILDKNRKAKKKSSKCVYNLAKQCRCHFNLTNFLAKF